MRYIFRKCCGNDIYSNFTPLDLSISLREVISLREIVTSFKVKNNQKLSLATVSFETIFSKKTINYSLSKYSYINKTPKEQKIYQ